MANYCQQTLGLETYLPRLRQHRTIRRQRSLVTSAMFPRYLFCRFDFVQYFRAVRFAPDAIDLVQFGSGPAVVSDDLISELKSWPGVKDGVMTVASQFTLGDKVEICAGPLQGLTATILQVDDARDRVALLLSILHDAQLSLSRTLIRRVS